MEVKKLALFNRKKRTTLSVRLEVQGDHSTRVPPGTVEACEQWLESLGLQGDWTLKVRCTHIRGRRSGDGRNPKVKALWVTNYGIDVMVQPGTRDTCRRCELVPPRSYIPEQLFKLMRPESVCTVMDLITEADNSNDCSRLANMANVTLSDFAKATGNAVADINRGKGLKQLFKWSRSKQRELVERICSKMRWPDQGIDGWALNQAICDVAGKQRCFDLVLNRAALTQLGVVQPKSVDQNIFVFGDIGWAHFEDIRETQEAKERAQKVAKREQLSNQLASLRTALEQFEDRVALERGKRKAAIAEAERKLEEAESFVEELDEF